MLNQFIDNIRNKHEYIFKVLLFLVAITIVVLVLPREGKFKYEFQENKPWLHEDLLAPFDFAINKTPAELENERKSIKEKHLLVFNFKSEVKEDAFKTYKKWLKNNYNDTLNLGDKVVYHLEGLKYLTKVYDRGIIEINDEIEGKDQDYSILVLGVDNVGEQVEIGNLFSIKTAYDFIVNELSDSPVSNTDFLLSGIEGNLKQNIILNSELTQKDLESELNNLSLVGGGVFEKEKIISTGEIVTFEKFKILQSLKDEYELKIGSSYQSIWIVIGQILLVLLFFYSIFVFLKNVNPNLFSNNMHIGFVLLIVVGFIAITGLLLKFENLSVYTIPFCIIPLLIRTFFGNRAALFVYTITIFLISFMVPNSFEFVLLEIITGIITLHTVLNVNKRAELFYTSAVIFMVFLSTYIGVSLLQEGNIENIDWSKTGGFAIGAALTLLTYPLIYIFEKMFGFVSDVTLLELADTNNKLLRELNLKAPGTFQHTLQVSNLAEEAIHEIGGNPLLVRTGALYHDIGKMLAPAYFIENQTGINPHDDLGYEESADIIINHVIKGIELAKKHNLPEQVIDFIRTHHGTTKTQYFLRMFAKDNPDLEMDEERFQYPGPIPYSKETAALMMADSVEAASRSLKTYDLESITNLVEGIIDYQVKENQFVNTNITFRDISTVKKLFIKKLMNIYHVRIEYPK
jgi:cyclic-di-AMP phosphodiesterase PgpH